MIALLVGAALAGPYAEVCGPDPLIAVFEAYELASGEQPTYAELAEQLGVPKHTVRNHLAAVRERVRDAMRVALRDTVATGAQLEDEWRELFGGA